MQNPGSILYWMSATCQALDQKLETVPLPGETQSAIHSQGLLKRTQCCLNNRACQGQHHKAISRERSSRPEPMFDLAAQDNCHSRCCLFYPVPDQGFLGSSLRAPRVSSEEKEKLFLSSCVCSANAPCTQDSVS